MANNLSRRSKPGVTPEERENQLISLAVDAVEERIRNGKATSQELCHYLKLGTTSSRLEKEKLKCEVELLKAKTDAIVQQKEMSEVYSKAIKAMSIYQGRGDEDDEDFDEDENFYPDIF